MVIFFFVSLSATLGTLPLILFYFNRLSLVTLIANMIVVPILGVIAIPFCLLIVIAVPISPWLADIIIQISALLVRISLSLTRKTCVITLVVGFCLHTHASGNRGLLSPPDLGRFLAGAVEKPG